MPSNSYQSFRNNLADTDKLISVHRHLNNGNPGKKGLGYITRSGILMLSATWELYIESLLLEALQVVVDNTDSPSDLPSRVQETFSGLVKTDKKDSLKPLTLAGNGWRTELKLYAELKTERLHNPNSEKVDKLYRDYLGMDALISSDLIEYKKPLDRFLSERGEIAHKGAAAKYVKINNIKGDRSMIFNLAQGADNIVLSHIKKISSSRAWNRI